MSVPNSLTRADALVLRHLLRATDKDQLVDNQDGTASLQFLTLANDPSQSQFQPTVFTSWDLKDLDLSGFINRVFLTRYISWAQGVVRNPTDVVFVTHTLLYLSTLVPSALYLFYRFSWTHALLHWLMEAYSCGPFTIMLHNHIHNDGVLDRKYSVLDRLIPYVLEPLMGHTWDSYYYHHVKHHHVENNGPDDLSSTLRYQRDSPVDFLIYLGRFAFLIWIELPLYFFTKRKYSLAIKSFMSEFSSMMMIFCLTRYNFNAGLIVLILPLVQMRIGMMLGNWGQHAFVDEADPTSNYRSSITLIDAQSNRYCFNDGYHTSHHLNPRRHWRDHPRAFLNGLDQYQSEGALVFKHVDFLLITVHLLRKDYDHLANCLVPIGDQIGKSRRELASMLREKARRFTEDDIQLKFSRKV